MSQHMEALANANRIRRARADLKRRVASGDLTVREILLNPIPDEARSMPISHLLAAQRRWGPARAQELCERLGIGERRAVGDLTLRQRRVICGAACESLPQHQTAAKAPQTWISGWGPEVLS